MRLRTLAVLVLTLPLTPLAACRPETPTVDDRAFAQANQRIDDAREAAARARAYLDLWLGRIDAPTGLFPRNSADEGTPSWRPADNAADNYPYLVLAAALFDDGLLSGPLEQLLRDETARTTRLDGLVDEYAIDTQSFVFPDEDLDRMLYNSAEYAKDGLVPVTELLDTSPWSDRLVALTDSIWRHAEFPVPSGRLPTDNVEVHGELLQVTCRLYWRTGDSRYLEFATRIGDYYLLDQHPTRVRKSLLLDDHGNEIVGGLSELYLTVSHVDPARYAKYRRPFHDLLDDIAEYGRNDRGLLYLRVGTPAGDPRDHGPALSDTWGYVLNAFFTAYLVDGTPRYREVVVHALEGLQAFRDYDWEPDAPHDGLADSTEGAIMLGSYLPLPQVDQWIAEQVARMWEVEDERVIPGVDYLHGNVARTTLMYLLMLTQGARLRPWPADVAMAAVARGKRLFVTLESDRAWRGTLTLDGERHSTVWGLPENYPRINAFPEWFVVDPDTTYRVTYVDTGEVERRTGAELLAGIPLALDVGHHRLEIAPVVGKAVGKVAANARGQRM